MNNLSTLLSSSVGTNFSAVYTYITDAAETVTASISDEISAGVYQVEVELDKMQVAGDYNLDVLLGGLGVPTPQIEIRPCTNFFAIEAGLVPPQGSVNQLDTLDYTIKDDQATI